MQIWQIVLLGILGVVAAAGVVFVSIPNVPSDVLEQGEEIVFDHSFLTPIESSNELLNEMVSGIGLPGVSVSVGIGGETVWSRAIGYANISEKRPMTTSTASRIGSVSKSVTSLAVGKLMEQGLLDLDAPLDQYSIQFPQQPSNITSRHLVTHTSGIRHYQPGVGPFPSDEMLSNIHYETVTDSLEMFSESPLLFEPGAGFNYSTYGYTLLSAVIESASGKPYLNYMDSEIFRPLQMTHSIPELKNLDGTDVASYYISMAGKIIDAPEVDNSNKWAGGGLLSTPTDLINMTHALFYDDFLQPETLELLFTPQLLKNGEVNEQNYGMGWRIDDVNFANDEDELVSFKVIHHGGTSNGANAFLIIFPKEGVAVAMTTNALAMERSEFFSTAYRIAKRFIDFGAP